MNPPQEENYSYSYISKYIQIWLFLILMFTCLFILLFIGNYNINYLTRDKLLDYRIISSLNPKYPPPLFNFMN